MLSNSLTQKRFQLPVLNKHPQALSESSTRSLSRAPSTHKTNSDSVHHHHFTIVFHKCTTIAFVSFRLACVLLFRGYFLGFMMINMQHSFPKLRDNTRFGLTKNISFGWKWMMGGEPGDAREVQWHRDSSFYFLLVWKSRRLEWNTFNKHQTH